MNVADAKRTMNYLMKVEKNLSEFDGMEHNPANRKKLYDAIQYVLAVSDFHRKDNKQQKMVELWWNEDRYNHGMAADVSIGLTTENKFWVQTDILWKTIAGYNEVVRGI